MPRRWRRNQGAGRSSVHGTYRVCDPPPEEHHTLSRLHTETGNLGDKGAKPPSHQKLLHSWNGSSFPCPQFPCTEILPPELLLPSLAYVTPSPTAQDPRSQHSDPKHEEAGLRPLQGADFGTWVWPCPEIPSVLTTPLWPPPCPSCMSLAFAWPVSPNPVEGLFLFCPSVNRAHTPIPQNKCN